jgi:hypothetical protein
VMEQNSDKKDKQKAQRPGFSIRSLTAPLIQAPSVIPQLIPSLCSVSITTCNKLFKIMILLMGITIDHDSTLKWETEHFHGY